jgi:hypothetical protein
MDRIFDHNGNIKNYGSPMLISKKYKSPITSWIEFQKKIYEIRKQRKSTDKKLDDRIEKILNELDKLIKEKVKSSLYNEQKSYSK